MTNQKHNPPEIELPIMDIHGSTVTVHGIETNLRNGKPDFKLSQITAEIERLETARRTPPVKDYLMFAKALSNLKKAWQKTSLKSLEKFTLR